MMLPNEQNADKEEWGEDKQTKGVRAYPLADTIWNPVFYQQHAAYLLPLSKW
jgi:hypothetical protein